MILILALMLVACSSTGSPVPTSEESITREAELLIRASLTDRLMQNTENYYRDQMSSMLAGQGGSLEEAEATVNEALQRMIAAEHQRLVDALVPIYLRYYTAEEIHQLLSFFETKVARKSVQVSPQIAAEIQEYARLWNEHFGAELLQKIDAEK